MLFAITQHLNARVVAELLSIGQLKQLIPGLHEWPHAQGLAIYSEPAYRANKFNSILNQNQVLYASD